MSRKKTTPLPYDLAIPLLGTPQRQCSERHGLELSRQYSLWWPKLKAIQMPVHKQMSKLRHSHTTEQCTAVNCMNDLQLHILHHPGGPDVSTRSWTRKREGGGACHIDVMAAGPDQSPLAWKMEAGWTRNASSPQRLEDMRTASLFQSHQKGRQSCQHLNFSPIKTISDF